MPINAETVAKFWSQVVKSDGCWEWSGSRTGDGYGALHESGNPKQYKTHRVSYELHHGPIPPGMYVCHHCDNPPCVRPDHLYAGTATDNNRDTIRRKRRKETKQAHCLRGHPMTPDNLLRTSSGGRRCKTCKLAHNAEMFQKHGKRWRENWRQQNPPKGRYNPTHCPSGHEYTEANTRWQVQGDGYRHRKCRSCDRERAARKRLAS